MSARLPTVGEVWKLGPCDVEVLAVHDGTRKAWVKGTQPDGWPVTVDFDELTPGPPVAEDVIEIVWDPEYTFQLRDPNAYRGERYTLVATVARMSDGTFRTEQMQP